MLLSHRPSPPGQLDTRADSPMREKAHLAGTSSVNRNTVHGLPTPATDVPSSGFTAVNGESHRSTSFRPDESARDTASHAAALPNAGQGPTSAYNAWRPDDRRDGEPVGQSDQNGSPSSKRKRGEEGEEGGRNDRSSAIGDRSPKRPMTVLNSGGIRSPQQISQTWAYSAEHDDLEQPTTGTYER